MIRFVRRRRRACEAAGRDRPRHSRPRGARCAAAASRSAELQQPGEVRVTTRSRRARCAGCTLFGFDNYIIIIITVDMRLPGYRLANLNSRKLAHMSQLVRVSGNKSLDGKPGATSTGPTPRFPQFTSAAARDRPRSRCAPMHRIAAAAFDKCSGFLVCS